VNLPEPLGALVAVGLALLLVSLRFDAERFGAAEYDEATDGRAPSLSRRLAWYALGIAGIVGIALIHPRPQDDLFLGPGDQAATLVGGFLYAMIGTGQAVAFAWLRYQRLRLPDPASYPGALMNAVATAFFDEGVFRGALLGLLLVAGVDPTVASLTQALLYGLSTRLGKPGREPYMLALALIIGLAGGWLTVATGGIAAAFLGHAVTRFAVFLCTGHAGQVALRGGEEEDIERRRRPPEGWRVIGSR
jgi:membrane protease YdiL (CAAX protease family)